MIVIDDPKRVVYKHAMEKIYLFCGALFVERRACGWWDACETDRFTKTASRRVIGPDAAPLVPDLAPLSFLLPVPAPSPDTEIRFRA